MNWYEWNEDEELLYADGAWDAAFEQTGCKPVAVDFRCSPFGRTRQKNGERWSNSADGMIFDVPFYKFVAVIGINGIFGDDFIGEYKRRYKITNDKDYEGDVTSAQFYYNATRSVTVTDYNAQQMEQLRKKLEK